MLKTNYKNDNFEGNRKYQMIQNSDGTVSFLDVTTYAESGDVLGAVELNQICTEVNGKAKKTIVVQTTLLASSWVGTQAPYTQVVANSSILATHDIDYDIKNDITISKQVMEAYLDAQILVISQANGSITLRALGDLPVVDIPFEIHLGE